MKDKPKTLWRTMRQMLVAAAVAGGMRGAHDTPYSELSVNGSYHSRYQFGFDHHKAKLRAIKDRRRSGRR